MKRDDLGGKAPGHASRGDAVLPEDKIDALALPDGLAIAGVLDCLAQGVILVGIGGKALYANLAGREVLAQGNGLVLEEGRIAALVEGETEALHRLIANALMDRSQGGGSSDPQGQPQRRGQPPGMENGALAISRLEPLRPLSLIVSPLDAHHVIKTRQKPLAAIFLGDPGRGINMAEGELMALFKFTQAEANLAIALLEGKGIDWASKRVCLSANTARTHLKRIFEKTGTHRQAELVRLAMSVPAVRRRHQSRL